MKLLIISQLQKSSSIANAIKESQTILIFVIQVNIKHFTTMGGFIERYKYHDYSSSRRYIFYFFFLPRRLQWAVLLDNISWNLVSIYLDNLLVANSACM